MPLLSAVRFQYCGKVTPQNSARILKQNISEFSKFSDLDEFATWERYVRQAGRHRLSQHLHENTDLQSVKTKIKKRNKYFLEIQQFRNVRDGNTMCCIFAFAF